MKQLTDKKKERLEQLFKELEGAIKFDGSACDLIKELRRTGFSKAV